MTCASLAAAARAATFCVRRTFEMPAAPAAEAAEEVDDERWCEGECEREREQQSGGEAPAPSVCCALGVVLVEARRACAHDARAQEDDRGGRAHAR